MNYEPDFSPDPFDGGQSKKIRGYFSRIGLALTLMMAVYIGLQFAVALAVKQWAPQVMGEQWYVWLLTFVPLYIAGVPTFVLVMRKVPAVPPERQKFGVGEWFLTLIMCFGIMYVGSYVGNMLMVLINSMTGRESVNALSQLLMSSSPWFNLGVTVFIAPLIEEMIFRRAIIDRTRPYGEGIAIVFSALLFGLFHGNLYQFFYAFGLGLMLAYVYVRTGKVYITILLHMVINFFGCVIAPFILSRLDTEELTEFVTKFNEMSESGTLDPQILEGVSADLLKWIMLYGLYAFVFMALAITGVVLLFVRRRKFHLESSEFPLPRERVGSIVYFNPGVFSAIIVGLLLMIMSLLG